MLGHSWLWFFSRQDVVVLVVLFFVLAEFSVVFLKLLAMFVELLCL